MTAMHDTILAHGKAPFAGASRLEPFALKDAPALIEAVFPAQKVSFEAQRERKAGAGQTLTALGSYWKGRKPLILVRAIVLGSLLPQTDDPEKDLEVFEQLMAFDEGGLARREPKINPADIAQRVALEEPWNYFIASLKGNSQDKQKIADAQFPLDLDLYPGLNIRWRRDIDEVDKLDLLARALATWPTYEERAALCKRPEEMDQAVLYAPIWPAVNAHLGHLGIEAHSHQELVEQLGILRYGHRPRVGDTFCGGGSIPFEAARLGCDVYASDLNPIACMLTWGALNIIGAPAERRAEIERAQREVAEAVDREITALGIEHDSQGNRAKAYLYCLETRCPETGWMVPMAPSWVISKTRNVIAQLIPDNVNQRFDIEVQSGVSAAAMKAAERGTMHEGNLVYELDGKTHRMPIKTLRGDYSDADGDVANLLRRWEQEDFKPHAGDIFQERLYAIQWITKETLDSSRRETFFASVSAGDLERERKVDAIVERNLAEWQERGLVPDMELEPGGPPRYQGKSLITNLGWRYWHQLFNPRKLILGAILRKYGTSPANLVFLARTLNRSSKLCMWEGPSGYESTSHVFTNQALNALNNWGVRGWVFLEDLYLCETLQWDVSQRYLIKQCPSNVVDFDADFWITDPPYADAVMYHEITDFFIAWLRKNPPPPFDQWTWDSRRDLAIKGSGDDFRRGMVEAYKAMTHHMPDNGMQCVMFTHQDSGVWSDMVSIFWASGLQVVGAWYIATETTSELKKGGFVQGTVILMLRKRPFGDRPGFKQRILPEVKREVDAQIKQMMHLNTETQTKMGAPVFNDSDLQMAGYAAALKVLTGYTSIGGEDVTAFALRPRRKGETTVVDEIVEQAAETANGLLVPEGLERETWAAIGGMQRFYLRMLDMETTGAAKLDNYQNFAKAFRVADYAAVMASIKPNAARLKSITEFKPRDLTDRTELGPTPLGALIVAIQEFLAEKDPAVVMANLRDALVDYLDKRPILMDMADFIAAKARGAEIRRAAEAIASRIRHQRLQ
jgi:putative DNA methylase